MAACDSLENGVILLYNRICAKANAELDILLEESEIDRILRGEDQDAAPEVIALAEREAQNLSTTCSAACGSGCWNSSPAK